MLACALGAVAPCVCYFPWLIATPMAYVGLYRAVQGRDERDPSLSNLALISNAVAAVVGSFGLLLMLAYFAYVVFVFGLIGAGAFNSV